MLGVNLKFGPDDAEGKAPDEQKAEIVQALGARPRGELRARRPHEGAVRRDQRPKNKNQPISARGAPRSAAPPGPKGETS